MKLNKLKLLEKIRKEKLESILVDLKIQQELLTKYQSKLTELEQQKILELEIASQDSSINFSISNFLLHINQEIEQLNSAIGACLNRIDFIEDSVRDHFQELKQVELLIAKTIKQINETVAKKEQLVLDELAINNKFKPSTMET